jgi:hypothetical protein
MTPETVKPTTIGTHNSAVDELEEVEHAQQHQRRGENRQEFQRPAERSEFLVDRYCDVPIANVLGLVVGRQEHRSIMPVIQRRLTAGAPPRLLVWGMAGFVPLLSASP